MKRRRIVSSLAGLGCGLLLASCIPLFSDGLFQTLRISFRLDRALPQGEAAVVHLASFPDDVKVKKTFVQISGRLTPADGEELPGQLTVEGAIEAPASGRVIQRLKLRLNVDDAGDFKASARVRKDISAGEMLTVTVEPADRSLAAGSELTLCVDLVKKKGDLRLLPDCVTPDEPSDPGGGNDPDAAFSSLVDDHLAPTCARAGCHSAASASSGLVLDQAGAYANLVGVASVERPELERVTPGDPDNSYLIQKLRGDGGIVGGRMPLGGPFLSAAEIDRFVRWIESGALDN